ncbi:MAG TPA: hypothetical protein VHZ76_06805, partial [Gammaproteobacteria bacterium]|nr:hypothetical protein [Gammaproteobacteria bacterium]
LSSVITNTTTLQHIWFNFTACEIDQTGLEILAKAIVKSRTKLKLTLTENNIGKFENIIILTDAIQNGETPRGLYLDLSYNHIKTDDILKLAHAIQSGYAPQDLSLDLSGNSLSDADVIILANAIQSGKAPEGLNLILRVNNITVEGIRALANAVCSGKAPANLHLDIASNNVNDAGATILANAIKGGCAPIGLHLNLSANHIGPDGVVTLAGAIKSGNAPKIFKLNLNANNIDNKGIEALAKSIESGCAPYYLSLKLRGGNLIDEGILTLANALKNDEAMCYLRDLQLDLSGNKIGEVGINALEKALHSNIRVTKLSLDSVLTNQLNIIKHCCLRNRLILQYPNLESFIKELSYKANVYIPGKKPMRSLAFSLQSIVASSFLFEHYHIYKNNSHLIPEDLNEYISNLMIIKEQLSINVAPILNSSVSMQVKN